MIENNMKKLLLPITLLLFVISCEKSPYDYKYFTGELPDEPVNFEQINTEYDDYNSTAPSLGETFPLCFSSTRKSKGGDFDIVYKLISISFSKMTGELSIFENTSSNLDVYIENENLNEAINKVNTINNELGPYLIPVGDGHRPVGNGYQSFQNYILLYSNDEQGKYNIKLTHNTTDYSYDTIVDIDYLNSNLNDCYPTLNSDRTKFYWSSDRNGDFSFYSVDIINTGDILSDILNSNSSNIEKEDVLSSDKDDKCPYITSDFIVFASNRAGGYGGYDLYYSRFENGEWSSPINFGDKINTEYDEFRPIVRPLGDSSYFKNDFMLFSSNRPGGKGGFDLYYVGIQKVWR